MKARLEAFLKLQGLFRLGRWTVVAYRDGEVIPELPPFKVRTYSRFGAQQLAKELNADGGVSYVVERVG